MNIAIEFPARSVPVAVKIGAPSEATRLVNLKNAVEIEGVARIGTRSLSAAQRIVGGSSRDETLIRLKRKIEPHVEVAE